MGSSKPAGGGVEVSYILGKKALIYSVPGTGTRFARKLLEVCFNYNSVGLDKMMACSVESRVFSAHHVGAEPLSKTTRDHHEIKTVIPLRSPVAHYITRWRAMEGGRRNASRNAAIQFWRDLKENLPRYNHVFLPLEEDFDRKRVIWRVANHLETMPDTLALKQFCAEWPKIGSAGPRPEREEYDAKGDVAIDGHFMGFLDEAMGWYSELIQGYGVAA